MTETEEKMIRVAWKTVVMPVHAYVYYHPGYYDSSVVWPDQEVSEVPASEVLQKEIICLECCKQVIRQAIEEVQALKKRGVV